VGGVSDKSRNYIAKKGVGGVLTDDLEDRRSAPNHWLHGSHQRKGGAEKKELKMSGEMEKRVFKE